MDEPKPSTSVVSKCKVEDYSDREVTPGANEDTAMNPSDNPSTEVETPTVDITKPVRSNSLSESDTCAICLGCLKRSTRLDTCRHSFCYDCIFEWLRHSANGSCPMCKTVVNYLLVKNDSGPDEQISVQQLRDSFKAEACLERGNAVQLNSEREVIMARIRQLRCALARLDEIEKFPRRRDPRFRPRESIVDESTSLRSLMDAIDNNSISRADLISNARFRRCIYTVPCERYSVDEANPMRRSFTPRVCMEAYEENSAKLVPWIQSELNHAKVTEGLRNFSSEYVAEQIFRACASHQIHSPSFLTVLMRFGFGRREAEQFQHELFEFASSCLSSYQYCGISGYRLSAHLPTIRRAVRPVPTTNNFYVGGLRNQNGDVIDLSDEENDDVVVLEETGNIAGPSTSGEARHRNRESLYVRDDPDSASDEDHASIFARNSLRLHPFGGRIHSFPSNLWSLSGMAFGNPFGIQNRSPTYNQIFPVEVRPPAPQMSLQEPIVVLDDGADGGEPAGQRHDSNISASQSSGSSGSSGRNRQPELNPREAILGDEQGIGPETRRCMIALEQAARNFTGGDLAQFSRYVERLRQTCREREREERKARKRVNRDQEHRHGRSGRHHRDHQPSHRDSKRPRASRDRSQDRRARSLSSNGNGNERGRERRGRSDRSE